MKFLLASMKRLGENIALVETKDIRSAKQAREVQDEIERVMKHLHKLDLQMKDLIVSGAIE